MRSLDCRSVLIILSLLLASFAASAQNSPLMLRSSNQLNQSGERPESATTPGSTSVEGTSADASDAPLTVNSLGRIPDELIASLMLDPAQNAKLEAAHAARRKMWFVNRTLRQVEYAELTKALSTDKFDPREAIALRKKTRAKIDAGFDEVQATWLAFWDALNPSQRIKLIAYMREQHELQGKASAEALAARNAARAKQKAALERAEARAATQQGGTTSNNATPGTTPSTTK
ncbi:MAG: hypothetical protein WCK56_12530 [Alcaligenaceae bacterium]